MSLDVGRDVRTPVTALCDSRMDFWFAVPLISRSANPFSVPLRFTSLCTTKAGVIIILLDVYECSTSRLCQSNSESSSELLLDSLSRPDPGAIVQSTTFM